MIVDDSLGLAEELESRMSHVIGTYQDEWRTAVENPEIRKRFQTYINATAAAQADPHIQFTHVRDQIRPLNDAERAKDRIPMVEA